MHMQAPTVRLYLNGLAYMLWVKNDTQKRLSVTGWSITRPAECFAAAQLGIGAKLEFTSFSRALCRQIRAKRRIG